MSRKTMVLLLKSILMIAMLFLIAGCVFVVPNFGRGMAGLYPEFSWAYIPCLIWAWAFTIPIMVAIFLLWFVFSSIADERGAFVSANVRRIRWISRLAFLDALIFPAGMLIVSFMGASQPVLAVIITPLVVFLCAAVGVMSWVLSNLLCEAIRYREENELTI